MNKDVSPTLDLGLITLQLEGLEETIIYHLIERVQYKRNAPVYVKGKSGFKGFPDKCLLDIRLLYQENMDAQFGRFCVPEERPYNPDLPEPQRRMHLPDFPLKLRDYNAVNLTARIREAYQELINRICREGDDGQYGSSVENDVYALQAISCRVHYGAMYVAESKYRQNPGQYTDAIRAKDRTALLEALTRKEVEECIILRVKEKVAILQAKANTKIRTIIDPELILSFYRDTIIPLTKEGEISYLINRR